MTTTPKKVEARIFDKRYALETGSLARQANGAVFARYEDTAVLATVVALDEKSEGEDFLPLTINYQEKSAAAGKIPGGYFKREGRPNEKEVLTSRLIDRPIRPLSRAILPIRLRLSLPYFRQTPITTRTCSR